MKKIPFTIDFAATGFYLGKIPFMPGTFGSLVAIPIGYFGSLIYPGLRIILAAALFFGGVFISTAFSRLSGIKDPSCVVIDEIAALSMIYFIFPFTPFYVISGFLFFRLFDILKPFPIKYIEEFREGWGIMADDVMAAIYAAAACSFLKYTVDKFI